MTLFDTELDFEYLVDRVGIDDIKIEQYSDYDSSDSLNDFNVREALRTSLSQKTTVYKPTPIKMHIPMTMNDQSLSLEHSSRSPLGSGTNSDDDLDIELDLPHRKGKKPKIEDRESAAVRRERNRLAAQRCRQRRRDRIDKLEKICQKLENDGDKLQLEIKDLQKEMNDLQRILDNHSCVTKPVKTGIFMPNDKKIGHSW